MRSSETDLFAGLIQADVSSRTEFQVTPEFVARIRGELNEALTLVRDAELRLNSLVRWLPEAEAAQLRDAFEAEMTRLYNAEDRRAEAG